MAENMPRIRSSIIVGIGGSGALAALYAKRSLIQFYEKIPYSIRFLILDTDNRRPMPLKVNIKGERWAVAGIEEHEFRYLSVDDPLNVIRVSPSIKRWWPEGIPTRAILNGAGGYRARGRLAFHAHAHEVDGVIKKVVEEVMAGDLAHNMRMEQELELIVGAVDVYVVGSLAGGTGSGSFIDAGFLFQQALENVKHRVIGFFILPSVFEGLPATLRVTMNGYAALNELDHYFGIHYLRQKPRFIFGDKEFSPGRPPYDVVNLMDAVQEKGQVIPGKGTDRGVETLCRIVGEGMALNLGNVGQKAESACDNLYDHIVSQDFKKWGGKRPHYSTIGVSSIIYPMEKHFNQLSAYYSYALVDGLLGMIREGVEEAREKQAEDDVNKCLTEAKLEKHIILEDIIPSENLLFYLSTEGISSPAELDQEVGSGRRRRDSLREQIDQNHHVKMKEAKENVSGSLKGWEETEGVIYARKAAEKIAARYGVFRDEILSEVKEFEEEHSSSQKKAQDFYEENVKRVGWKEWVLRRRDEIFQDYLDQMGRIFGLELKIDRHRKTLAIINELVKTLKEYIEGLGLGAIEMRLSRVREAIEKGYFGTSKMVDQYGQYSLVLYPKEIAIEGPIPRDRELILLPLEFEKLNIPLPNAKEFLQKNDMAVADLERVDEEDLKKRIMSYAHERVSPIRKIDIERILPLRKEGIDYWLREASRRSTPLWHHNAAAELAAMMEEIFIIGVEDEYRTSLRETAFPEAKYPPTFMSTSDAHKTFLFKYKAPLPAYLLADMERYRLIYLETSLEGTPHVEDKMELMLPDLFPEDVVQAQAFRLYTLAMAKGLIKEERVYGRYIIDDARCLKPGEDRLELGYPAWRVFEELKRDGRKDLRESLDSVFREEMKANPEKIKQALDAYYQNIKKAFDERDASMSLGDELLLHRQITFLDEFSRGGADLEKILS